MTVNEAITLVDNREPNQYTSEDKLGWLNTLDGQIFNELILTHEHEDGAEFTPYSDATADLLVPFPYAEEVYVNYLKAMIEESNHEIVKYNASMMLFNTAYQRYANWINRTVKPFHKDNRLHF